MTRILLFAGTGDGRELAERLAALPVSLTVSVATNYGKEALAGLAERIDIRCGRLDCDAICALIADQGDCAAVADATHPHAVLASENIRKAAALTGLPYLRLLRSASAAHDCRYFSSVGQAAACLCETEGPILAATGAKELREYTVVPDYANRIYPRILPTLEGLQECVKLGFQRTHIIAMQGPFTREFNIALMRQFAIDVLVTKDSGATGGFEEKMQAAEQLGIQTFVIGRPPEEKGDTMDEIVAKIRALAEGKA